MALSMWDPTFGWLEYDPEADAFRLADPDGFYLDRDDPEFEDDDE